MNLFELTLYSISIKFNAMVSYPNSELMKKTLLLSLVLIVSLISQAQSMMCFNGKSDAKDLGAHIGNGLRTIEMWFMLNEPIDPSLANFSTLVAREISLHNNKNEFSFSFQPHYVKNPGTLRFDIDGKEPVKSVYSNNNTWEANRWYHVAAVIHPKKGMMLFLDGKLQDRTHPHTKATASVSDHTFVGKWGDLDMRYFNGCIKDLEFSKDALYTEDFNLHEPLAREPQKSVPQHEREMEEPEPQAEVVDWELVEPACKCDFDFETIEISYIDIEELVVEEEELTLLVEEIVPDEVETKQTEITEVEELESKVYPNPSTGIFNFQFENLNDPTAQIRIYNMMGQLITSVKALDATVVNIENQVTGTYVYQVVGEKGVLKTGQLIKQ